MQTRNPGGPIETGAFAKAGLDAAAIDAHAETFAGATPPASEVAGRLVEAIGCIDLTTLSGDDTAARVRRLCARAVAPLPDDLCAALGLGAAPRVASVCVYPTMVRHAVRALEGSGVPVASVAAGFPAGLTPRHLRLEEIRWAVGEGAAEIDVVITRELVLTGAWQALHDEVAAMREACGGAKLKVILSTGDLRSHDEIHAAATVAMQAGADFIKTSTGKEAVNATLPAGLVMISALRTHAARTGQRIGFKPAGGLKTAGDALAWQAMVAAELGAPWRGPSLFRFGASSMLDDIVRALRHRAV